MIPKIRISQEELKERPLFVATPMFGGQCCGGYVHGLLNLNTVMVQNQLTLQYFSMANESLITRGRNYCAYEFLKSMCTHLLFIDADICFTPDDALSLLAWADPKSDKDVICGVYPHKRIHWDRIESAVKNGVATENLSACGSDLAFNPIGKHVVFDVYEPLEVVNSASGFMMIQKRVFYEFIKQYEDRFYISDGKEREDLKGGKIYAFFETHIEESGRYLSEDFNFCRIARDLGFKVWVAPWVQLTHFGSYRFGGNLSARSEPVKEAASEAA